jgi:hypothetical protein
MHLKTSTKIAALVRKTVAHYQKTKDYCVDLYREAVEELYGRGPWSLTYLQVKTLHDQLKGLLVEGGLSRNTATSYLKACNRVVLFGATFDFGRTGSLQDVEKLQAKVKSYTEGTAQDKYDRAVKEVLEEKRRPAMTEPSFKVRAMRDGESMGDYIKLVETELSNALQQQVTIQLKIKKRRPA